MEYKVPFVNYPLQYKNLEKELDSVMKKVLVGGDLILRKDVETLEENIAHFVGAKYGIGVNSCTDALIFSLRAAGIGEGDEVITVSHTFFATIEAVVHCGAAPVLVDVGEDFLMDMGKVEEAVTPKSRAIIPVHLNGRVCDMEKLTAIAKKHNLIVIEDAAQALGAKFGGKAAGSFGLAGCFSFYPAKILGCFGDGGMVVTNDENIAEKIRLLRNHGQKTKTEIVCCGFTSRLHNLQAAVLNAKFGYLPSWIQRRREIAGLYAQGLSDVSEVKLPSQSQEPFFDVYQNYVLRAQRRDELAQFLKDNGVEILIKDPIPNHKQPVLNFSDLHLPVTEKLAQEVISIPMYPELANEQIEYVINSIRNFYHR